MYSNQTEEIKEIIEIYKNQSYFNLFFNSFIKSVLGLI